MDGRFGLGLDGADQLDFDLIAGRVIGRGPPRGEHVAGFVQELMSRPLGTLGCTEAYASSDRRR